MTNSPTRPPTGDAWPEQLHVAPPRLWRTLVVAALASIAAIVIVAGLLAGLQYRDAKSQAQRDMRARAVLAATVFDTYFTGEVAALSTMAEAPSVRLIRPMEMRAYLGRVLRRHPQLFPGGIGWADRRGIVQVSTQPQAEMVVDIAQRSYFRRVRETDRPFISEGIVGASGRRVIAIAVPTHALDGSPTGVLVGALELQPAGDDSRALELGYEGLVVLDREGQDLTSPDLRRPTNAALVPRLGSRDGVLDGVRGLDGRDGHVVAYANSRVAGWTTVIDRPSGAVYAAARRALAVQVASIAIATLLLAGLLGWALARSRRAVAAARREAQRWDQLTRSLAAAVSTDDIATALAAVLADALPRAGIAVLLEHDERPGLEVAALQRSAGIPERLWLDAGALAYATGETATLLGREALTARWPALDADGHAAQPAALAAVPISGEIAGAPLGAVVVLSDDAEDVSATARARIAAHAREAGLALARTRRFELEHDVAIALQRSLLPQGLPEVEGLRLAGRYQAGGAGLEIGGDWYDVVQRPDGIVHVTVGDVAGRGIDAAAMMGQLRNAFRAYALDHAEPGQVLARLGRHVPVDGMATAVCLTLDPLGGTLRCASAGHPPPLLLDGTTGRADRIECPGAPPLGWGADDGIDDSTVVLAPGSLVLAYSDGLVERRGEPLDDRIDAVGATLEATAGLPVDAIVDRLLANAVDHQAHDDDLAMLATRFVGPPARVRIVVPAAAPQLRGIRHRVGAWLDARAIAPARRADVVLALSEALNNAVEHAYDRATGQITVTLEHSDERLLIEVADSGAWRERRRDETRGRGLPIMRSTMDEVRVERGRAGTVVSLVVELDDRDQDAERDPDREPATQRRS